MESTGSAVREFNAYHQYRQQLQSDAAADISGVIVERNIAAPKHHNPGVEAVSRDRLAPNELRQRVCTFDFVAGDQFHFCNINFPFFTGG